MIKELLARLRAVTRRPQVEIRSKLTVADLELDSKRHEVRRGGKLIDLTPKEFGILEYLLSRKGLVLRFEIPARRGPAPVACLCREAVVDRESEAAAPGLVEQGAGPRPLGRGLPHFYICHCGINIAYRIRVEETLLEEAFGKEYAEYRRTTGCLVPRLL